MAKPVLLYFNLRARGELPRFVAAVGGIDFEDKRIPFSDWPGEYKSKTPYGQIPCLIVDGKYYAQKHAICLYLARKAGLYPKSGCELEQLKYDQVLNLTEDILEQIIQALVDKNFQKKPETLTKLRNEVLPKNLPLLEKILKENSTGFFVGNKLSLIDLCAFDIEEHVADIEGKSYFDSYPLIKAHFDRVGQNEGLKKYIESRPEKLANLDF